MAKNRRTSAENRQRYLEMIKRDPSLATKVTEKKKLVVFSRHPTHSALRLPDIKMPIRTSIRFGSRNRGNAKYPLELNMPEAVDVSANKLLMKRAFRDSAVKTAEWWTYDMKAKRFKYQDFDGEETRIENLSYPIIAKNIFGSRNRGNAKLDSKEELQTFLDTKVKNPLNYIFERFYNYSTEYRIHVNATTGECFYNLRKMLKQDTPDDEKWYRNDKNSVWFVEENEKFDKPDNWQDICNHAIAALRAVGLDLGAMDVKVQSSTNQKKEKRKVREFIIIETNSAPSFGERTALEYLKQVKILAEQYVKHNEAIYGRVEKAAPKGLKKGVRKEKVKERALPSPWQFCRSGSNEWQSGSVFVTRTQDTMLNETMNRLTRIKRGTVETFLTRNGLYDLRIKPNK